MKESLEVPLQHLPHVGHPEDLSLQLALPGVDDVAGLLQPAVDLVVRLPFGQPQGGQGVREELLLQQEAQAQLLESLPQEGGPLPIAANPRL